MFKFKKPPEKIIIIMLACIQYFVSGVLAIVVKTDLHMALQIGLITGLVCYLPFLKFK